MKQSILALAFPAALLGAQTQAATLTEAAFFGDPGTVEIAQFDPANGQLIAATLFIDAIAERASGHLCSGTETITDEVTLSVSLLGQTYADAAGFSYDCQEAGDIFEIILQAVIDITDPILPANLGDVVGLGTLLAEIDNNAYFALGEISLTYDFNPVAAVPLPAGGALLLTALGALGLRRRG